MGNGYSFFSAVVTTLPYFVSILIDKNIISPVRMLRHASNKCITNLML